MLELEENLKKEKKSMKKIFLMIFRCYLTSISSLKNVLVFCLKLHCICAFGVVGKSWSLAAIT